MRRPLFHRWRPRPWNGDWPYGRVIGRCCPCRRSSLQPHPADRMACLCPTEPCPEASSQIHLAAPWIWDITLDATSRVDHWTFHRSWLFSPWFVSIVGSAAWIPPGGPSVRPSVRSLVRSFVHSFVSSFVSFVSFVRSFVFVSFRFVRSCRSFRRSIVVIIIVVVGVVVFVVFGYCWCGC